MVIKADVSELKKATWPEYAVRFVFGGCMTVIAGLVAKRYGPELGGLFLAFPALDMFGTVWGSVGLLAFGLVVWRMSPSHNASIVLPTATVAWFIGALSTWELRRIVKQRKRSPRKASVQQISVHRPK